MPFCLDYAVSFSVFAGLVSLAKDREVDLRSRPWLTVTFGAASGLAAAVVLWPVDLVRTIATSSGTNQMMPSKNSFATCLVPFCASYIGGFFAFRPQHPSLAEKVSCATVATALGLALEVPFDHAKHGLFGGGGVALGKKARFFEVGVLAAIRLPFATMLLLVFDQIIGHDRITE